MNRATQSLITFLLMTGSAIAGAQECQTGTIKASTPTARFVIENNGIVKDAETGLQWSRCSIGQQYTDGSCSGQPTFFTSWQEALLAVKALNEGSQPAGFTDWRLPNIKELDTIVERQCFQPSINQQVFPDTPSVNYFTSTPFDASTLGYDYVARSINFSDGTEFDPVVDPQFTVRVVRSEESL